MPSPRDDSPRAVPPVQLLARNRPPGAPMSGPFTGKPVAVRNGLPVRVNYPLGRNTRAKSMTAAEAARHLGARHA